jgi:uncharacterized protein YukJ
MPLDNYGVLKGRAVALHREHHDYTPHYQVHIDAEIAQFRIAINVQSRTGPSELLFLLDRNFNHPLTNHLITLPLGWNPLPSEPGGAALDYVRGNLLKRKAMRKQPANRRGPNNDLGDYLEAQIMQAMNDYEALIYAFGQRWGPEPEPDHIFKFKPSNGVHDIHMNQGNLPAFAEDDGVWQDGGLLIQFSKPKPHWVALFLAFQAQSWQTDDRTGHRIERNAPATGNVRRKPIAAESVQIVGALVNPIGSDINKETVTLMNTTPHTLNLNGWQIVDERGERHTLSGMLAAGASVVVRLPARVRLDNFGGSITLLDALGETIDKVTYTRKQAMRAGWTIVF